MAGVNYNLFRGRDATLQAYAFNKVAPWAIFVGKELMCSYNDDSLDEGAEVLGEFIDAMVDNKMEGTYQLRLYRDVPPKGIMNNTPYSYSFRFQLYSEDEYQDLNPMHRQLKALKEEIQKLKEGDDEEEEDTSFQGQIAGILKDPDTRRMIIMGVAGLVRNMFSKFTAGPASMGATPGMAEQQQGPTMEQAYRSLTTEEQQKFDQATYFLLCNDPNAGTNLLKLAELLQKNPAMYQQLTKMTV